MAPDITVGDEHPKCDTYRRGPHNPVKAHAMVSSCKVMDCAFNESEMCEASGITVSGHQGHADCVTYRT
jgi:hypothetical protein